LSDLPTAAASNAETVLGLDNVPLQLPVASVGNRALAAFVDYFVLAVLSAAATAVVIAVVAFTELGFGWGMALWLVAMFLLNTSYFAVMEVALGGQTPGKRLLALRVVSRDGGAPSVGALVVRNLVRVIDNLVGVVLIATDPLARRLGDRLAGTLVVHAQERSVEAVVTRAPAGWGPRQIGAVEAFLDRHAVLEPKRSHHMARRILAWVERDDPGFLDAAPAPDDPVARVVAAFSGTRTAGPGGSVSAGSQPADEPAGTGPGA
jgi:uncharacterized RDD family membrane protein YckC